jgi:hypothetical protein
VLSALHLRTLLLVRTQCSSTRKGLPSLLAVTNTPMAVQWLQQHCAVRAHSSATEVLTLTADHTSIVTPIHCGHQLLARFSKLTCAQTGSPSEPCIAVRALAASTHLWSAGRSLLLG